MKHDLTVAGIIIVFSLAYLFGVYSINEPSAGYAAVGPRTFPLLIGFGMLISGLWLGFVAIQARRRKPAMDELEAIDWATWGGTAGLLLAYMLLLQPVGYLITTVVYLIAAPRILGSRSWLRDVIVAVLVSLAIYFLFNSLLKVGLPKGVLG